VDWFPTRSMRGPRVAGALIVGLLLALGLLSVIASTSAAAATIRCAYDGDALVAAAGSGPSNCAWLEGSQDPVPEKAWEFDSPLSHDL
jgi:hypothetical protein